MPSAIAALPPPEHGPMATGHNLIRHQIERMQTLVPTSGFATLEELGNAVSALGPPRAKVVELLKKETNFEFAMRAPEDIRDNIAKQGFLNQYDAKRSNGTFDPNARANVESSFLGMSREEYDKLPNTVRPKYGYLRPSATSGVRMADDAVGHYGSDIFVFKREAVRDYLTVYPNDSLGYSVHSWPVTPVAEEPSQWHHALLPWSTRMLLAPGLEVSDSGDLQFSQQTPAGFRNYPKRWGDRYLEIQIWRPLGLENVERFEFQSMPPSGDFLKALRQNGVKIFKKGDSEEWKGDLATPSQATIRMLRRPVVREALHTLLAEAA